MPALTSLAIGAGVLGAASAAAGAFGKSTPTYQSPIADNTQGNVNNLNNLLAQYQGLNQSLTGGTNATNDYANLLQSYTQNGGGPTAQDNALAQAYAQSQFAPQGVQLKQTFQDQTYAANNQAALSGRGINDPVLRAKLAQEQARQQTLLNSQQGALATQYATQLPGQRLSYAEGRANVLTANDQRLLGNQQNVLGAAMQNSQFQYGITSNAQNMNYQAQANTPSTLQNIASTFQGGLAGAGTGLSAYGALSGLGSSSTSNNFKMPQFGSSYPAPAAPTYSLGSFNFGK